MFKYLLLKSIFDLSDVDVVERSKYDMSFKYFLDMALEEEKEEVDYCNEIISIDENEPKIAVIPAVKEKLNVLKEVVEDHTEQLSFSSDPDARVGHKIADSSFFCFKTHIAMSDERIITAAIVTTGEKSDGKYLQELVEKSKATGMDIKTVIGDTAYLEKENIQYANQNKLQLVAKLNPNITQGTRKKEDEFEFNKDAGMYVCKAGHLAIRKARTGKKGINKNQKDTYMFDIKKCKVCPFRNGYYKEGDLFLFEKLLLIKNYYLLKTYVFQKPHIE